MDAAMVGVLAGLAGTLVTAVAAYYGQRLSARGQREETAVTGFNSLTDQLQEERTELTRQIGDLRSELAAERVRSATLETECSTLRARVTQLGGGP